MALEKINPDGVHPPQGYAHAAVAAGGRTVYTAGQVALDASGALVGGDDLAAQAAQAFRNLRAVLAAAGAGLADVAHLRIHVVDLDADALAAVVTAAAEVYGADFPVTAATMLGVQALVEPGARIEIEAVAVVEG